MILRRALRHLRAFRRYAADGKEKITAIREGGVVEHNATVIMWDIANESIEATRIFSRTVDYVM